MRESFVFHEEFIKDIPNELKGEWAMYAINYGLYDIEPEFTDWRDIRDWNKTKSYIDDDKAKYEARLENLRAANEKRHNEAESKKAESANSESRTEPNGQSRRRVSVSVSDNVYVSASDSVSHAEEKNTASQPEENIQNVCNELFNTERYIFSEDFAPSVNSICKQFDVIPDNYLRFVYDKAKLKNAKSPKNLFYKMATSEQIMSEYLSVKNPPRKKIKWINCPVCGAEATDKDLFCDCCNFNLNEIANAERVAEWKKEFVPRE